MDSVSYTAGYTMSQLSVMFSRHRDGTLPEQVEQRSANAHGHGETQCNDGIQKTTAQTDQLELALNRAHG